jgi:hypothetical protein
MSGRLAMIILENAAEALATGDFAFLLVRFEPWQQDLMVALFAALAEAMRSARPSAGPVGHVEALGLLSPDASIRRRPSRAAKKALS